MAESSAKDLLARLAAKGPQENTSDLWAAITAAAPDHDPQPAAAPLPAAAADAKLEDLLNRVTGLVNKVSGQAAPPAPRPHAAPAVHTGGAGSEPQAAGSAFSDSDPFVPIEPTSFRQARLTEAEVEALILKFLLARGSSVGRDIADQIKLSFKMIDELLRQMKQDQLVVYRNSAPMNDFDYQLTDLGRERARRLSDHCTYFGAAPVALVEYIASIKVQSLTRQHPTENDLKRAFADLSISQRMLSRLGPAINSGRGLFLYGPPGNGKTSIAERVTRSFGQEIWIPRSLVVDGEIIRMFDPSNHEELATAQEEGLLNRHNVDRRWVRIRRPTIVVGGELTMESLEVNYNRTSGICEAPVQLKSNCGTLVIDDFGRQRISTTDLLNRWIVPLEKRIDYLNMPNGKKIEVPFDQLIIFSTNLEPRDLADEAFLRRVPYKIDVVDPDEAEFRALLESMARNMGFPENPASVDYLIDAHYKKAQRHFRYCHPRDLLSQIRNYCVYLKRPLELSNDYFDYAIDNYFAVM
jgi:DNA-binding HxlR family transcriptional regulator